MFSKLIGSVDVNAAVVLSVFFICLCISITTMIGKRRSNRELEMQFEIDKQKLRNEDESNKRSGQFSFERDMAKLVAEREVQFKRIESGLIEAKAN